MEVSLALAGAVSSLVAGLASTYLRLARRSRSLRPPGEGRTGQDRTGFQPEIEWLWSSLRLMSAHEESELKQRFKSDLPVIEDFLSETKG